MLQENEAGDRHVHGYRGNKSAGPLRLRRAGGNGLIEIIAQELVPPRILGAQGFQALASDRGIDGHGREPLDG
jgi:hypothetical protein